MQDSHGYGSGLLTGTRSIVKIHFTTASYELPELSFNLEFIPDPPHSGE